MDSFFVNVPQLAPVHSIFVVLAHQPLQKLAEDRLVVQHCAHDQEALAELLPYMIHSVMLLDTVRLRNRRFTLHPLDPTIPATLRERLSRYSQWHELARHVALVPDTHPRVLFLLPEPKRHHCVRASLRCGQGCRRVDMHARFVEKGGKNKLQLDNGIEVGVQDGAFGQAAHDAPQLGALHAVLGESEHHSGVHGAVLAHGKLVFVLGRPERALLFGADAVDDATCALGDGGEVLAEGVVWRICVNNIL